MPSIAWSSTSSLAPEACLIPTVSSAASFCFGSRRATTTPAFASTVTTQCGGSDTETPSTMTVPSAGSANATDADSSRQAIVFTYMGGDSRRSFARRSLTAVNFTDRAGKP
jgi:hypothetical protein